MKAEKTISRRWTLKMAFLGDDKKSLVYELILSLVSLWLLVNLIKKGNSQRKRPIDFTKRYFLLLYYYFAFFLL